MSYFNHVIMKEIKCFIVFVLVFLGTILATSAQEATATESIETTLLGEHVFGVQFIWDGYGIAHITKNEAGELCIKGEQYSKDKEEYVLLEGEITIIDDRNFTITGHLKLFTKGCCGLLDRDFSYTFRKTGKRKYWRLKEREELCSQYTCAYYLDIFE